MLESSGLHVGSARLQSVIEMEFVAWCIRSLGASLGIYLAIQASSFAAACGARFGPTEPSFDIWAKTRFGEMS